MNRPSTFAVPTPVYNDITKIDSVLPGARLVGGAGPIFRLTNAKHFTSCGYCVSHPAT